MLLHTRQSSTQNNKCQVSHKHSVSPDDCLVCRSTCSYIPDSHPHRIASTKCRITVVSPDDCLVCRSICSCIPDSHPHRITSAKCRTNTVVSPDDCLVCRSICSCIPDSHLHRITSAKCRISTVVSPNDGHKVARNMLRSININMLRINCAPSWLYLQYYTETHSQQNTKTVPH